MACKDCLKKKIKNIGTGFINYVSGKETEESKHRFAICEKCSDKLEIISFGNKKNYICEHCNCFLRAKVTVVDEKCPIGKW